MAEPKRFPFWGSLLKPQAISGECGCHCRNCDERSWCEEQYFQELEEQRLKSEVDNNDN